MRVEWALATRYFVLLGIVYLLILGATAPAALLGSAFFARSGIAFQHLTGTLWSGAADEARIATDAGLVQLRDFKWRLQWRYLLRAEIALKLETTSAAGHLTLARGFAGLRVADADLILPATALTQIFPQLSLWQPSGEVQFQTLGFALTLPTPDGARSEAQVIWRNAGLNLAPHPPLGDYRLQLRNSDDKINLRLETQAGKLRLAGTGEYFKPTGLNFTGSAHADGAHRAELQALLATLGKDRGDGVHIFNFHLPH